VDVEVLVGDVGHDGQVVVAGGDAALARPCDVVSSTAISKPRRPSRPGALYVGASGWWCASVSAPGPMTA